MKKPSVQPNPLTDPIVPAIRSAALVTAASTGLFAAIGSERIDEDQLAKKLDLNPQGLRRLADVLVACDYLNRVDHNYELTEVSRMALVKGAPFELTNWLEFSRIQLRAVSCLESALRENRSIDLFELMTGEAEFLIHQRAMAETAKPAADWVASNTPVPAGATTMLDVGGSHGVYSAAICRRNPPLESEVLELPSVVEMARAVSKEHATDRFVRFIEGDILTTTLSKSYDVVFLGNVLHHLPDEKAGSVLAKIAANTSPNGTLAIWDLAETEEEPDEASACFSLFFYLTSGAKCYSESEIAGMLQTSGFSDIQTARPPGISTHILYTARKRRE
jgi:2-polyprenyl-3-methyl-5-hydroxy-6-metoxy-1,4-benzoquinol methylase